VDPKLDFPGSFSVEFSGYRTLASYPLIKNNQIYGAVTIYSSTLDQYSAEQLNLIERAVFLAATALSAATQAILLEGELRPGDDDFIPRAAIGSNVLN
jgi:GAF domain-containing protein